MWALHIIKQNPVLLTMPPLTILILNIGIIEQMSIWVEIGCIIILDMIPSLYLTFQCGIILFAAGKTKL